jgi:hypothetical protein
MPLRHIRNLDTIDKIDTAMSRPKGLPKTGGRRKGSVNRVPSATQRTREIVQEAVVVAVASHQTPLEYMLAVLRDPTVDYHRRDDMAKAAAPYVHAKLAMTAIAVDNRIAPPASPEEGKAIEDLALAAAFGTEGTSWPLLPHAPPASPTEIGAEGVNVDDAAD